MYDLGNFKNSVGLKPKAKLRKDAKAPSGNIGAELVIQCLSGCIPKYARKNQSWTIIH